MEGDGDGGGGEGEEGGLGKPEWLNGAAEEVGKGGGREGWADLRLCPLVWGMEREKDSQKSLCMVLGF